MQEGICFSRYSLKLYIVVRCYLRLAIVLAREDVEVHIHACKTKTQHFWMAVWANCYLEKLRHSHLTMLRNSSLQTSRFYDHHTIFFVNKLLVHMYVVKNTNMCF